MQWSILPKDIKSEIIYNAADLRTLGTFYVSMVKSGLQSVCREWRDLIRNEYRFSQILNINWDGSFPFVLKPAPPNENYIIRRGITIRGANEYPLPRFFLKDKEGNEIGAECWHMVEKYLIVISFQEETDSEVLIVYDLRSLSKPVFMEPNISNFCENRCELGIWDSTDTIKGLMVYIVSEEAGYIFNVNIKEGLLTNVHIGPSHHHILGYHGMYTWDHYKEKFYFTSWEYPVRHHGKIVFLDEMKSGIVWLPHADNEKQYFIDKEGLKIHHLNGNKVTKKGDILNAECALSFGDLHFIMCEDKVFVFDTIAETIISKIKLSKAAKIYITQEEKYILWETKG